MTIKELYEWAIKNEVENLAVYTVGYADTYLLSPEDINVAYKEYGRIYITVSLRD